MSWKSDFRAVVTLPHRAELVETVLLDAPLLPDWNQAFSRVSPSEGSRYRVSALGGVLRGSLTYIDSSADIAMVVDLPGLREHSTWMLEETGSGTRATHRVQQQGTLVPLIGATEASAVPLKRLTRLQAYLGRLS